MTDVNICHSWRRRGGPPAHGGVARAAERDAVEPHPSAGIAEPPGRDASVPGWTLPAASIAGPVPPGLPCLSFQALAGEPAPATVTLLAPSGGAAATYTLRDTFVTAISLGSRAGGNVGVGLTLDYTGASVVR